MTEDPKTVNFAVVYTDPPSLRTEVVERPVPEPGPGEVLVRLSYSGVCHSDLGFCTNSYVHVPPTPAGQVGGHEGLGEVIAHGPSVTYPSVGTKVGIKYTARACLSCANCLQGGESTCESKTEYKISGFLHPGTFQQYVVSPANYATPIPDSITDLAAAAPLMCGGVTVYTALKRVGVKQGDWVVISGAGGGLGHLAVQYAKVMGGRVLGIDDSTKEKTVKELGAEVFLDFTAFENDEDLAARVNDVTGGGAQIVMVCTSSPRSYASGMMWLGFRGKLCCLGIPEKEIQPALGVSILLMVAKELTIMSNKSGNRLEALETVEIAARHGIKTQYQLRNMDELTTIFEEMQAGKITGRTVLDLR
ncbi:putative alcohol dehydrogenase [Cryphonectria parasitica EP155]|uniref:Alcohol dehydrogenase n=1 Tax=Cryphonectria parasitica (strain ATCC 38755 / EP155) TaxID=660469 RepID=A0A9P5CSG4_CRYP1|nr:putative alcohol dehydrogenase [Cryphonectria parasitica EP155]KAF3768110.1 putative alcohol dehydrogenase [Cryphonectria parasitica EP155]